MVVQPPLLKYEELRPRDISNLPSVRLDVRSRAGFITQVSFLLVLYSFYSKSCVPRGGPCVFNRQQETGVMLYPLQKHISKEGKWMLLSTDVGFPITHFLGPMLQCLSENLLGSDAMKRGIRPGSCLKSMRWNRAHVWKTTVKSVYLSASEKSTVYGCRIYRKPSAKLENLNASLSITEQ